MFTKGPWEISRIEFHPPHIAPANNKGKPICYMAACFNEDNANARLIAAAPDLYEACKEMLKCFHMDSDMEEDFVSEINKAEQAILRAEGKQ